MIVGYFLSPKELDTHMWSHKFDELPKCATCGFRTDIFATNLDYKIRRQTPDIFGTYDFQIVVTRRFKEICETNSLHGAEYVPFSKDPEHFHFKSHRILRVDLNKSHFEFTKKCPACGIYRGVRTKGNEMWLMDLPEEPGFYRTDVLFGGSNRIFPLYIINEQTKSLLIGSKLTGFKEFVPVYGDFAPPTAVRQRISLPRRPRSATPLDEVRVSKVRKTHSSAFRCRLNGMPKRRVLIPVETQLGAPVSKIDLEEGKRMLRGHAVQLLDFYQLHNGLQYLCQPGTENCALLLAPVSEWKSLTQEAIRSLPGATDSANFVTIGEVPGSGNFVTVMLDAENAGKIALTSHEIGDTDIFANDLNDLLDIITEDPVDLITNLLGGYLRYENEESSDWIPTEFVAGVRERK